MATITNKLPLTNPGSVGVDPIAVYAFDGDLTDSKNSYDMTILQGSAAYTTINGLSAINVATGDIFLHNANPAALQIGLDKNGAGDASLTFQCLASYQSGNGFLFRLRDVADTGNYVDNQLGGLRYLGAGNALSTEWEHGLGTDVTWDSGVPFRANALVHLVLVISSDGKTMSVYENGELGGITTVAQEAQKDTASNVQKFIVFGALECECAGMSLTPAAFTAAEVRASYMDVLDDTVKTDLRADTAVHPRLYLRVDGLPYYLWQGGDVAPPAEYALPPKKCLHAPTELTTELNLGSMSSSLSAMTIVLDNIKNSDETYFFGQLFAPARGENSPHLRVLQATGYEEYIEADATTIEVKTFGTEFPDYDVTDLIYMGPETMEFTGRTDDTLDVIKGKYPCVGNPNTDNWGLTYKRPQDEKEGYSMSITQYPNSWIGRRVALYVTTWNAEEGAWNSETHSKLLWTGRIDNGFTQLGPTGRWELGCISILDNLETQICTAMPVGALENINLQGDYGRKFMLISRDNTDGKLMSAIDIEVPKGIYLWPTLVQEINGQLGDPNNWSLYGGGTKDVWPVLKWAVGSGTIGLEMYASGWDERQIQFFSSSGNPKTGEKFCHALQALGFDGNGINEIMVTSDDDGGYFGTLAAGKVCLAYHPTAFSANGNKLYCTSDTADAFWPDQGDTASAQAHVTLKKALVNRREGASGDLTYKYTAIDTATNFFTLSEALAEETHDMGGYIAQADGEEEVKLYQSYVPQYRDGVYIRGPFEMLLYSLTSTGTPDYNGSFDKLPLALSVGIQDELVNVQSFFDADRAIAGDLSARVEYPLLEPIKWKELLQREAKLFGMALVWRRGQLAIANLLTPEFDLVDVTIDESNMLMPLDGLDVKTSADSVVNEYVVEVDYSLTEKKYFKEYTFRDWDSWNALNKTSKQVKIKHPGISNSKDFDVKKALEDELLSRPLRFPSQMVPVVIPRTLAYRLAVGDIVRFISDKVNDPFGTGTNTVNILATVLRLGWNYDTWSSPCVLMLHSRFANYGFAWAPAAMVDKSDGGGFTDNGVPEGGDYDLTLVGQYWGTGDDSHDGAPFDTVGYKIKILERNPLNVEAPVNDWSTGIKTAYNSTTRLLGIDDNLLPDFNTDMEYFVTFDDHDVVVAAQQSNIATYQANVDTELLGAEIAQRYN